MTVCWEGFEVLTDACPIGKKKHETGLTRTKTHSFVQNVLFHTVRI